MRVILFLAFFFGFITISTAQSTITSGNWSDASIWSTGVVPTSTSGVYAGNPITLDQNISITSGVYRFGSSTTAGTNTNVTDYPGGSAYTLTMTGGSLLIRTGTTTFEGAASIDNAIITIRSGATLILGPTTINNQSSITIDNGGTLIINGDFINHNNGTGTFDISGLVVVNGDYLADVGSVTITGGGDMYTTGTIETTGSSDVFGSTNDCTTGPCSGTNLSGYTNSITANQVICSGSTPASITGTTNYGGTPLYRWQRTTISLAAFTANSSTNSPVIGGATSANYQPPALNVTTWYRRQMSINGGTVWYSSYPVQISVLPTAGGWLGLTNSWNSNTNWCSSSVPDSNTDVTITTFPNGSGRFMPVISALAEVQTLTINSGATVTLSGANTLNIYGDLSNSGTLTDNTSSNIAMKGTGTQTIGGSTYNVFNNLTINNSTFTQPGVTLSGNNVNVKGTLTLTAGNVNLAGFTMEIGTSNSIVGAISRTGGWMYGGNIARWTTSAAVTVGSGTDFFPIGSSSYYRPVQVAHAAITTGGKIKVNHTDVTGSTVLSPTFNDNGTAIQVVSNSYWGISATGFTASGSPFTVTGGGTGFGTVGALTDLRLVVNTTTAMGGTPGTNSGSLTNPTVERLTVPLSSISNSTFRVASINSVQSPLPVRLIDFTGEGTLEGVLLKWSTSLEENFNYFDLERSVDGSNFKSIEKVPSNHTGQTISKYSYLDSRSIKGRSYYRLKSVDLDGYYEYSKIISVFSTFEGEAVSIYPNPTSSRSFNVKLPELITDANLTLHDQTGRMVYSTGLTENQKEISLGDNFKSGLYLLRIQGVNMSPVQMKLILKD